MELFQITRYGRFDHFGDLMRPGYKEPKDMKEHFKEIVEKGEKSPTELLTILDVYIGHPDGYAYGGYDRLLKMRKRGSFKPVGPTDMYKYPPTDSSNYGWFLTLPELKHLITDPWHKPRHHAICKSTDVTRYFDQCSKTDKFFRW